jgi:hypothetical protein
MELCIYINETTINPVLLIPETDYDKFTHLHILARANQISEMHCMRRYDFRPNTYIFHSK